MTLCITGISAPASPTSAPTAVLSGRNQRPKAGGKPFGTLPAAASRRPVARSHPFRVLTRGIQGFVEDLGAHSDVPHRIITFHHNQVPVCCLKKAKCQVQIRMQRGNWRLEKPLYDKPGTNAYILRKQPISRGGNIRSGSAADQTGGMRMCLPSRPWCTARISASTAIAMAPGDFPPQLSPMGAKTRRSFSGCRPLRFRNL